MKDKQAIVILGGQGSGQITRAIVEAEKIGTFAIVNVDELFARFLWPILSTKPDVIIVEGCTFETLSDPKIKALISEDKLLIERKGKDSELVPNVKWIFTVCIDQSIGRRFSVISV